MKRTYELEKLSDVALLKGRVYSVIKSKIVDLSFRPGEQLVEHRLAEELGVSKSPIRDAFQRLDAEGLVQTVPYKGCFVSRVSRQEFRGIFQLREALELFCLEQAFDSYSDDDLEEFREIVDRSVHYVKSGNELLAKNEHLAFHSLIVKKLQNELMENIYSNITDKLARYLNIAVTYIPNRIRISNQQHIKLFEAIKKRKKSLAMQELRQHLSHVLNDYLVREEITQFENAMMQSSTRI
jgi:DNA-binding GntR family transcriptional regulator